LKVMGRSGIQKVEVRADGTGLSSRAGTALLPLAAERVGLTDALGWALGETRERRSAHDPGRVFCDLAVMLADGGRCVSDLIALGSQPVLFGGVASVSTARRVLLSIGEVELDRLRAARAQARARAWAAGAAPEEVILDFDATPISAHSDKEGAAGHYKGGFGFHPLLVSCGREVLAAILRPGNAGANNADDHLEVFEVRGASPRRRERVTHPRPRAPLPHVLGRDPRLRQPPVGEQFAQPARALTIGLGAALAPAQGARLHRLGQMRHRAGGHQRVTDEQPARARLHRDMHLPAIKPPRPPFHGRRRRVDAATHHSPESVSNASKVICARCTSSPATIAIGASSKAPALPPRASLSRRAEEALAHAIFEKRASRSRIDARLLGTTSSSARGDGCSQTKPVVCGCSIEAPLAIELDETE
jgi:hypothetical protein